MKTDLSERLRKEANEHQTVYDDDRRRKALLSEAADELEKLRAENKRLLKALESIQTSAAIFVHEASKIAESDDDFPCLKTVLNLFADLRKAADCLKPEAGGKGK
ncbi:MAG: hypothetical protein WC329_05810 [Candidatus Omnitrophota bacterium]|jgi:predicted nuclease with TOPRIM domain